MFCKFLQLLFHLCVASREYFESVCVKRLKVNLVKVNLPFRSLNYRYVLVMIGEVRSFYAARASHVHSKNLVAMPCILALSTTAVSF